MTDDKKIESTYLVGDYHLLHLTEAPEGVYYEFFSKGQKEKQWEGHISKEDMQSMGITTHLSAAREIVNRDFDRDLNIAEVSSKMLRNYRSDFNKMVFVNPELWNNLKDDIRFIDPEYNELFRIKNGSSIEVTAPDRHYYAVCEYIDDYHLYVGSRAFHSCEFAQLLERLDATCYPEPISVQTQRAWEIGGKYLAIEECETGWDYSIYDNKYFFIDGGVFDKPELAINEARNEIMKIHDLSVYTMHDVEYDEISIKAEAKATEELSEKKESVLAQLKAQTVLPVEKSDNPKHKEEER